MLKEFTASIQKQNFVPEQSGDVYDPDTRLKKEAMKKRVEQRLASKKMVSEDLQLKKIISGMQKNVDQYGIEAAKELGIDYGGSVNKGFKVVPAGSNSPNFQEFVDSGKWEEIESQDYRDRTKLNAQNADGTVWFGKTGTDSAGHNATKRYSGNKPWIENPTDKELRQWLIDNNIKTLNVAGNRSYGTEELGQQAQETIVKAVQGDIPTSKNTLKIYYPYANKNKTINHANSYKQIVEAQNPGLTVELVDNKSQSDMVFGRGQGMGNPFSHESSHKEVIVKTRFFDETMIMYEAWLKGEPMPEGTVPITPEQQKRLDALKSEWDNKLKPFINIDKVKTFEVSTKGDDFGKQFSALNATFKEGPYAGRTIEDVWQKEIKKSGKGRGPGPGSILEPGNFQQSKDEYQKLWQMWADENPELITKLKNKVDEGYSLIDSYAGDPNKTVNQAEALTNIVNKPVGGSLGAAKLNDPNVFDKLVEEYTPGSKFLDDFKSSIPGYILVPFEQMLESGLKASGYSNAAKVAGKLVAYELYTFATSIGANLIGRGEGALTSPRLAQAYLLLGNEEEFKKRAENVEQDMMENSAAVGQPLMSAIIKAMPSYWLDEWLLKRNPEFEGWKEMFPQVGTLKKGAEIGLRKLFGNE